MSTKRKIAVSMLDFLRTGQFGPVRLGISRAELQGCLGNPEDWRPYPKAEQHAAIWKYGDIEFYFDKSDSLWMIFADGIENLRGGAVVGIAPWIFHVGLLVADVLASLSAVDIAYERIHWTLDDDTERYRVGAGVGLVFVDETKHLFCEDGVSPDARPGMTFDGLTAYRRSGQYYDPGRCPLAPNNGGTGLRRCGCCWYGAKSNMGSGSIYSHDTKALLAAQPKTDVLRDYRWTATMFYCALDAGALGIEPKVEMIRGRLVEHPGQTPRHAYAVGHLGRCFRDVLEPALQVHGHCPIAISDDTHADTDIVVAKDLRSECEERHPSPDESLLLVEVSDRTTEYDLGEKAFIYAQADIADYWVVLVNEDTVVVHRQPSADGYQSIMRLSGGDTLSPLALPSTAWNVNALLGK